MAFPSGASTLTPRSKRSTTKEGSRAMRKLFEIGGLVAAAVLIAFGIGSIAMSVDGRSTVRDSLKLEQIVGTPDMTPEAIAAEAKAAGLTGVDLPTKSVAGTPIDTGDRARTFASYMRVHALEETGRYVAKPGAPAKVTDGHGATNDPQYAVTDPKTQRPVENGARNTWVTETALSTALNVSYMAEQLALFGLVVGIALLLAGIGFAVLAIGGALRNPETALTIFRRRDRTVTAAPTA